MRREHIPRPWDRFPVGRLEERRRRPAKPGERPRRPMRSAISSQPALFAAPGLPAALDGLQHLPRFPAAGRVGGDLGGTARGAARTAGAGGEPQRRRHRQLLAQVGRKGGCAKGEADAVGYDAGKRVKGRKVHALVDTEGLPLRVVVHSAAIQDRTAPPWSSIVSASASIGSNSSGPTAATTPARSNTPSPRNRRCGWRSSNVPTAVQDLSSCRVAGSLNAPFRGSAETAVWPRTTRTSPTPSPPSSPSPASNSPSGGSPGRRLLSQALSDSVWLSNG